MKQELSYRTNLHWQQYQPFFPETFRVEGPDVPRERWWRWGNAEIHVDEQAAHQDKDIKFLLLHGGGGHGRLLAPLGMALKKQGYDSIAPDLPGYGLSEVTADLVTYSHWIDCCVDLILEEYRKDNKPFILFGLSLGGMLAYYVAARIQNLNLNEIPVIGVISTTLCDGRDNRVKKGLSRYQWLAPFMLPVLDHLPDWILAARMPIRWVSKMDKIANDRALAQVVLEDKLGGGNWTSLNFLRSIFKTVPDVEPEEFRLCPILLAHPEEDLMTPIELSLPFYQRIKAEKELVLLRNAGHVPIEEPGWSQLYDSVEAFARARAQAFSKPAPQELNEG